MLPCFDFFFSLEIILFFCFKGKRNAFLGQYLISTVNLQKYEKNQLDKLFIFSVYSDYFYKCWEFNYFILSISGNFERPISED